MVYKKFYYNFYTYTYIDEEDNEFEELIKEYIKNTKTYPDLKFVINLDWENLLRANTYEKIEKILLTLNGYGITKDSVVVGVNKDNHKFNAKEWKLIRALDKKFKEMDVVFGFEDMNKTFTIQEVENANAKINPLVDSIREKRLSPYEILLTGYLTVTSREYTEESEDEHASKSRSVYGVLNNDEIVCTGYAQYLKAIIEKVGNENITVYENSVGTSPDNKVLDGYHSNLVIYIKDEKYGIDGYYYLDPTWDSNVNDKNDVSSLLYFMVPLTDIKNMKLAHIRSEDALPFDEAEENGREIGDVILDDRDISEVSFSSDKPIVTTDMVNDFIDNNPQIMDILKKQLETRIFLKQYKDMEKYEKIMQAETEVLEMFEGNGISGISYDKMLQLKRAVERFEGDFDSKSLIKACEDIIEDYYTNFGQIKKVQESPVEFLKYKINAHRIFLNRASRAKHEIITDEEVLTSIMSDDQLLETIVGEMEKSSQPVHLGKTMDALRVVYSEMFPEYSPQEVKDRVVELIQNNTKQASRHYTKNSNNPFLELHYGTGKRGYKSKQERIK